MKKFVNNQEQNKYELVAYYPTLNELIDIFLNYYNSYDYPTLWILFSKSANKFKSARMLYENLEDFLIVFVQWVNQVKSICGTVPFNSINYKVRSKQQYENCIHLDIGKITSYHPESGYLIFQKNSEREVFYERVYEVISLKNGNVLDGLIDGDPSAIIDNCFFCSKLIQLDIDDPNSLENYESLCRIDEIRNCINKNEYELSQGGSICLPTTVNYNFFDYEIPIINNDIPFFEDNYFKIISQRHPSILEMNEWKF